MYFLMRYLCNRRIRKALNLQDCSDRDPRSYIKTVTSINEYLLHRGGAIYGDFHLEPHMHFIFDQSEVLEQFCRYAHRVGCEVYLKAVSRGEIENNPKQADDYMTAMHEKKYARERDLLYGIG